MMLLMEGYAVFVTQIVITVLAAVVFTISYGVTSDAEIAMVAD